MKILERFFERKNQAENEQSQRLHLEKGLGVFGAFVAKLGQVFGEGFSFGQKYAEIHRSQKGSMQEQNRVQMLCSNTALVFTEFFQKNFKSLI